jgi:hypothetical protein
MVVGLCHVCEALRLFPWMHWGLKHSVGHYLDFWSCVLGLMLFPIGYLFHALTSRQANLFSLGRSDSSPACMVGGHARFAIATEKVASLVFLSPI